MGMRHSSCGPRCVSACRLERNSRSQGRGRSAARRQKVWMSSCTIHENGHGRGPFASRATPADCCSSTPGLEWLPRPAASDEGQPQQAPKGSAETQCNRAECLAGELAPHCYFQLRLGGKKAPVIFLVAALPALIIPGFSAGQQRLGLF